MSTHLAATEYDDEFSNRARIALQELKKPKDFDDQSFEINFNSKHSGNKPVLWLNGSALVSPGQMACLIAGAGTGKSNLVEALGASAVNGDADAFGFRVSLPEDKAMLLIDTERISDDLVSGLLRIKRRAGTANSTYAYEQLTPDGNEYKRVTIRGFKSIGSSALRKETFERHVSSGRYALVVIDGIADFMDSMNDEKEATTICNWLEALGIKYNFAILCTIHPRPGDPNFKPNGHCGSQIWKKCRASFVAYKADEGTRIITTDFLYGKVSNAKDQLTSVFKWCDEEQMMITFRDGDQFKEAMNKFKTSKDLLILVERLFGEQESYYEDDLVKALKSAYKKPEKITKRTLTYMVQDLDWLEYVSPPVGFGSKGHYRKKTVDRMDNIGNQEDIPF